MEGELNMCGIVSVFELQDDLKDMRKRILNMAKQIRHRGPDWSGMYTHTNVIMAHERLAIVGIEHGAQPLYDAEQTLALAVNGEIYNHKQLAQPLASRYTFLTQSDCEVILPLYKEHGTDFLSKLNGMYAFTLYDSIRDAYLIARDPIGIIPLYWGRDSQGQLYVASELKALQDVCQEFEEFPPGHFYWSPDQTLCSFYQPSWQSTETLPQTPFSAQTLRTALEDAVKRQLMTDVPYGVLLSGGLDSSIIAAVTAQYAQGRIENDGLTPAWWPQVHSFTIGLKDSPDLQAAREVAEHIGSIHHEFTFTLQEGLDALADVIYHLETYDVTTIRASTPMYLMSRKIKAMGIKMLLSGEGADELFGGYLYFHKAPDARAFHQETVDKLAQLHLYDCLRANKSTAAWGIEARVPFLDLQFIETAMQLDPHEKMITSERMEKHILREAFADLLPESIAWRQKEQFSDGVGYSWIDQLKAYAEEEISTADMQSAHESFPYQTPQTKEAYLYRTLFAQHFPSESAARCVPAGPSIACSTPAAILWDAAFAHQNDPSGRAVQGVHNKSIQIQTASSESPTKE